MKLLEPLAGNICVASSMAPGLAASILNEETLETMTMGLGSAFSATQGSSAGMVKPVTGSRTKQLRLSVFSSTYQRMESIA